MRLRILIVMALVSAALLTGCVESQAYNEYQDEVTDWSLGKKFGVIWKDWALDLSDVASVELGGGPTFGATVMPTELLQVGFFTNNGVMKLGWRNRSAGFTMEERSEYGLSWFYFRDKLVEPIVGTPTLFDERLRPRQAEGYPIRYNVDWHWLDLGAEAGLIFFDVGAHVSPKETLDFAISSAALPFKLTLGMALHAAGVRVPSVDFCDDDTAAQVREKYDVKLIKHPPGFPPVEILNDLMKQPY
jgi:hypothetical protein